LISIGSICLLLLFMLLISSALSQVRLGCQRSVRGEPYEIAEMVSLVMKMKRQCSLMISTSWCCIASHCGCHCTLWSCAHCVWWQLAMAPLSQCSAASYKDTVYTM